MFRFTLLGISAAVAAGILFVNFYNSIVDAPNWGADLPNSIVATRAYFSASNPGNFFRIASPLNQVLALIAVVLCWKTNRKIALASLTIAILADVLTFGYFYPRNEILFIAPMDTDAIRLAWEEWSTVNWFRSGVCFVNTALAFTLLVPTVKKSEQ